MRLRSVMISVVTRRAYHAGRFDVRRPKLSSVFSILPHLGAPALALALAACAARRKGTPATASGAPDTSASSPLVVRVLADSGGPRDAAAPRLVSHATST